MIKLNNFSLLTRKVKNPIFTEYLLKDFSFSFEKNSVTVLFGEEGSGVTDFFKWIQYKNARLYSIKIDGVDKTYEEIGGLFIFIDEKEKTKKEKSKYLGSSIVINLDSIFSVIEMTPSYIIKQRFGYSQGKKKINSFIEILDFLDLKRTLIDAFFFQMSDGIAKQIYLALAFFLEYNIVFLENVNKNEDILLVHKLIKLFPDVTHIIHSKNISAINLSKMAYILYAGEVLEKGAPNELFYFPQHPYLWSILTSIPKFFQAPFSPQEGYYTKYAIEVKGDPYASRNPYATNLDFEEKPKWYKLSETHYARTFLLHEKIRNTFKPPIEIQKRWEYYKKVYGKK